MSKKSKLNPLAETDNLKLLEELCVWIEKNIDSTLPFATPVFCITGSSDNIKLPLTTAASRLGSLQRYAASCRRSVTCVINDRAKNKTLKIERQ